MAANNKQKLKLLYVYQMLIKDTDEKHGLTMTQILKKLASVGIEAERKSIYSDLEALRKFGLEIITFPHSPVEYAVLKDKVTLSEATLLIDAVQSCKFLTERKSNQLTKTLKNLVSTHQQVQLDKRVHVEGRIKSQNESVFNIVDTIHEAMRQKRKIEFVYYKYGADLQRHATRKQRYLQTPVKVVFTDGLYYLVAWSEHKEDFVTYRVDRMNFVQISSEEAQSNSAIKQYDYNDIEHQTFGMFGGVQENVTLRCKGDGIGVVVDKFGRKNLKPTNIIKAKDNECNTDGTSSCDVHVQVIVSPQFFGWLAGLSDIVKLISPNNVVDDYKNWIANLLEDDA